MNYNEIGAKALQEEKTEEAIQAFMQAIESNPEDPSGYINLGNIFAARRTIFPTSDRFR